MICIVPDFINGQYRLPMVWSVPTVHYGTLKTFEVGGYYVTGHVSGCVVLSITPARQM